MPADAGYAHQIKKLDDEAQTWLLLSAIGFFTGFMFLVGPAAWWKASDLRQKYESMRAPVPSNVNNLRLVGILTSVLSVLVVLAIFGVMVLGFAFAMHQR
ncbi:MAG: hypothetical protein U0325_03010 [Polyangiales bacterium]